MTEMVVVPLRMPPTMKERIERVKERSIRLGFPGTKQADVIRKCLLRGLALEEADLDSLERRQA